MTAEPLLKEKSAFGALEKLGGGSVPRWQLRFFVLNGCHLHYYDCANDAPPQPLSSETSIFQRFAVEGKKKGVIDCSNSMILDRGMLGGELPAFSIKGVNLKKGEKSYFLRCVGGVHAAEYKWQWLHALMDASGVRYSNLLHSFGNEEGKTKQRLAQSKLAIAGILGVDGNDTCADCGAYLPTWTVNRPFGTFVCIECIGVHRSLWANKCKEVQLDAWNDEEVTFIAGRGNKVANHEIEASWISGAPKKPKPGSTRAVREAFIKAKYGDRIFCLSEKNETTDGTISELPPRCALEEDLPGAETTSPQSASGLTLPGCPPKSIGVLTLMLLTATNAETEGVVACLANGFQHVISKPGKAGSGWNELLSLGTDSLARPLALSFFVGLQNLQRSD